MDSNTEKNVRIFLFRRFFVGDLIPVLNGYNPVNNPVVDSKVASAILVACEKYTPLLTNLSISGVRVS